MSYRLDPHFTITYDGELFQYNSGVQLRAISYSFYTYGEVMPFHMARIVHCYISNYHLTLLVQQGYFGCGESQLSAIVALVDMCSNSICIAVRSFIIY